MAKVFYIPYTKYELQSDLTQEELVNKIHSQISNHSLIGELTAKDKRKFSGSINLSTGEFQIRKRLNYRNNFNSNLKGRIIESGDGSRVLITLKLPIFNYIFLILFCTVWVLVNPFENLFWPLGGLAFVYFLTFFTFNMGAAEALDALHELV
ncbi:MAG: hypothetical protein ACJA2S_004939 [Cyclobacteriaceae bacterium]|jgi:hypothetical protein